MSPDTTETQAGPDHAIDDKHLLLDCDGVLLNWFEGFHAFIREDKAITPLQEKLERYDLTDWLGLSYEEVRDLIREFNETSERFGELEPYDEAATALQELARAGWSFTVITSVTRERSRGQLRRQNLVRHFGDIFKDIRCLDVWEGKRELLASYPPTAWVEDNYGNALDGLAAGHLPFVMRRDINRLEEHAVDSHPGVIWVDSMADVLTRLKHTPLAAIRAA